MGTLANIACKTVGLAGMSAVLYDAYGMAKHHANVGAARSAADIYESSIAAERSNTGASYVTSAMQKKVADLRMKNPIIPVFGKTKGFIEGFISALGDNIIPISLASVALAAKGFIQKAGAWGLGIYGLYLVAKEGFGMGKTTPVDK